jgi:uncharacterized membrane protein
VLSILCLHPNNLAIGLALFSIILFLAYMSRSYKEMLLTLVVGGVLPAICEIMAVQVGVWHYAKPSFFGIPFWLPLGWALASFVTSRALKLGSFSTTKKPKCENPVVENNKAA